MTTESQALRNSAIKALAEVLSKKWQDCVVAEVADEMRQKRIEDSLIAPTQQQIREYCDRNNIGYGSPIAAHLCQAIVDWQRGLFLEPVKKELKKAFALGRLWERFFVLADLEWKPSVRLESGFDFIITLPCSHSECAGFHILGVRVLEKAREALGHKYDEWYAGSEMWEEPHPALFGDGPKNTWWQMAHGPGGGIWSLDEWLPGAGNLWERVITEESAQREQEMY